MDGFNKYEQIVVIGATNHEGNLDQAAIRPGRFDKKIHIPKPDLGGWKDLFEFFLSKVKHNEAVDVAKLARMTPGFTGADVSNLVNTAISQAVHQGRSSADMPDFEYAWDRIMMGIERKNLTMSDRERLATAIHEAGHAITSLNTESARQLYKATIVSRGGSLGATFYLPSEAD